MVICPGSRSGPIALAAGALADSLDFNLVTAIDERSAAFLALGLSTATGKAAAVVTTSGTAVANLLPAAIEADRSCQPLLLFTADRPERLKNCGANQTVNQEDFLKPACRWFEQGPREGLHIISNDEIINEIVNRIWLKAHKFPGPVHFNIPFEEPLHASLSEQNQLKNYLKENNFKSIKSLKKEIDICQNKPQEDLPVLDPYRQGLILIGPWRGVSEKLDEFKNAIKIFHSLTGWPIFADPVSGIDNSQSGLIYHWDLLINCNQLIEKSKLQVLRLGPLSANRNLQDFLADCKFNQILITELETRYLDPLGISKQWSYGFKNWLDIFLKEELLKFKSPKNKKTFLLKRLLDKDYIINEWLDKSFPLHGLITEPSLARWLPRLFPQRSIVMLSASSPIRDWISFGGEESFKNRCFSFRGASGIDGTLSLAMGLAKAYGLTFLVTGDLALLHDSNGWLFSDPKGPRLIVFLIDNGGGGIFNQLGLCELPKESFQKLFSMPQKVDNLALVSAHGIPSRQISCLDDLPSAIEWSLSFEGPVLLRACTNSFKDNQLRNEQRNSLIRVIDANDNTN